jgi:hypothetical protein
VEYGQRCASDAVVKMQNPPPIYVTSRACSLFEPVVFSFFPLPPSLALYFRQLERFEANGISEKFWEVLHHQNLQGLLLIALFNANIIRNTSLKLTIDCKN